MSVASSLGRANDAVPLLEMSHISKRFGGVLALHDVSLAVGQGEIVALIGENGAGKSTLMKTLGGVHSPDEGEIRVSGAPVTIRSPRDAERLKIAFIHQELNVLDNLDVAANVYLGREPTRGGPFRLIDRARMERETEIYLKQLGLAVSPRTLVFELSLAQRQMIEIVKALSQEARIIILDEPTSSLTPGETERLLSVMRSLKAERGVSMVYISHRLGEILEIADRVVGLRDGKNAGELSRAEISQPAMVRLMIGRDLEHVLKNRAGQNMNEESEIPKASIPPEYVSYQTPEERREARQQELAQVKTPEEAWELVKKIEERVHTNRLRRERDAVESAPARLEVRGLRTPRYPNKEVAFAVRAGEVLGFAGLVGAGRTEVAQAIFGVEPALGGEILLDGAPILIASPGDAITHKIYLVPEDRRHSGLLLDLSIGENITLPGLMRFALGNGAWVKRGDEREAALSGAQRLTIKSAAARGAAEAGGNATATTAALLDAPASSLSGGNQQKIVLAKWLSLGPRVLIFDEPTRGIDVGAKAEIYALIRALARENVAVLIVSSDMEEVLGLSDRLAVMHEGGITGILPRERFAEETVMQLAVGNATAAANLPT